MTRESYDPEQIDALTLRVLALCSRLQALASRSRASQLESIPLHDRKALEWIEKLEHWLHKAEAEAELAIIKNRGAERAKAALRKASQ